jgi:hypothetical protein
MEIKNKLINCPICLEDIDGDVEFLPCIHKFHKTCIDSWIKETPVCPICKVPIYINTPEQLDIYNRHKKHVDQMSENESKIFQQISSGNFNNIDEIHTDTTNIITTSNFNIVPVIRNLQMVISENLNHQTQYIENIVQMFDTILNQSDLNNEVCNFSNY